jgi:hypothetical protein
MSDVDVLELLFSSTEEGIEGSIGDKKIIWKDILREGEFPVTPGRKRKIPFRVVPEGKSSVTPSMITISMSELMQSYNDKAFESVTIPLRHPKPGDDQEVLNNSGYVEGLRIVKKGEKHFLQGGLGFTEPDVAGKVRRGSVPNVSSGILFDWVRKADDKKFPVALNHVCLTKHPIIDDLEPFKRVYASDEAIDAEDIKIQVIDLDEEESSDDNTAEIVWNEQQSTNWIRTEIRAALSPEQPEIEGIPQMPRPFYEVLDVSREDTALVEEWFKGDRKRWVIPFTVGDNAVSISPATRWVEVREAMVAASDDIDKKSYSALAVKLGEELRNMLGQVGEKYSIDQITTDGRVSVKNGDDFSVFAAQFVEFGETVLLSATSEWEQIKAPEPKKKQSQSPANDVALSLMFDGTPEGRVAAARQRRRQMLSRKSQ